MPACELMQAGTSPPSKKRVMKEIGLLRRHKTVGSGELSPPVSRGGGGVFASELTKLRGSI